MIGYGNSMFLATHGILARAASGGGVDPDAQAFITAAGITNPTQQGAINTLVVSLKGYGIWTKFKAIYPIVGGSSSSHAVNLKTPGTYNLTFATGWTHSSTGMTPNGATYANTGINVNSVMTLNSSSFGIYNRTDTAAGFKAHGVSVGSYFVLFDKWIGNMTYGYINDNGSTGVTASNTDAKGFYQVSRTASNALRLVKNTTHYTSSAASSSKPNDNFYLGANHVGGGNFNYANDRQLAFGYLADGLSQTECDNLYTAVQAYQTTLSRQV